MAESDLVEALGPLLDAVGGVVIGPEHAASPDIGVRFDGEVVWIRLPHLDGALARLIAGVEQELGGRLAELDRERKQQAVALLHERGAFTLRKAVEDVAGALNVSRFTVYNYLDRISDPADPTDSG